MRQLAAVVLKHFVHADWPRLAEAEKACVRAALPAGLRDGHGRIRTAVSVVIAAVARTDWPEAWPTLLADLTLPLEEAGAATDTVAGALRCLEICAAELAGEHMRPALQRLLPRLLEVFVNRQGLHGARTRARAVRVLHKLVERASMLCDDEKLLQQLQRGPLAEWVGVLLAELATPLSEHEDCSVAIALLRLLRLLAEQAPLALKPHAPRLLPPLGALLAGAMAVSNARMVADDADALDGGGGVCDSDGGMLGLSALISQLLDVLAALAGSSRWSKLLLPALPEVFFGLVVLMQIPPATEATWATDLAQYLEDEDQDTFAVSTRVAAQQCVLELLDWYGRKALPPLVGAVQRCMAEAEQAGPPHGWRAREASWVTLALGGELLGEAAARRKRGGGGGAGAAGGAAGGAAAPPLEPSVLFTDARLLSADLTPTTPPLLRGRALCAAATFAAAAPAHALAPLVRAT